MRDLKAYLEIGAIASAVFFLTFAFHFYLDLLPANSPWKLGIQIGLFALVLIIMSIIVPHFKEFLDIDFFGFGRIPQKDMNRNVKKGEIASWAVLLLSLVLVTALERLTPLQLGSDGVYMIFAAVILIPIMQLLNAYVNGQVTARPFTYMYRDSEPKLFWFGVLLHIFFLLLAYGIYSLVAALHTDGSALITLF